jgi:NitT/TauT family transport system ATP-binding protein/sulfonate transport system ATP-binding protein
MAPGAALRIMIEEKRYAGQAVPIFCGLELEVRPSEHLVLFGPSGVGKSTLLRMVAGIDTQLTGRIEIDGLPPAEADRAGFVFQDPRLLPWATAADNILAVSPEVGREGARHLLAQMGLAGHEDALPHELSGGMQRRVALARALSVQPRLLILDEPFVSLDRQLARDLQDVVQRIVQDYAPTTLFVTHDAEDAARLADRVVRFAGHPACIVEEIVPPSPPATRSPSERDCVIRRLAAAPASFAPAS